MNSLEVYDQQEWHLVPLQVKLYDMAYPLFCVLEEEQLILFGNESKDKITGMLGDLKLDDLYIGIK